MVWEDEPDVWSAMAFDGVTVEGHSGDNIVTAYPVSKGFKVSEHTIRQNAKISLNVVVSNISMPVATVRQNFETAFEYLMDAVDGTGFYDSANKYGRLDFDNDSIDLFGDSFLGGVANTVANALTAQVSLEKVQTTFEKIKELTRTGKLVHVLTMRGAYTNCVLRNYNASNDVSNSYCLVATLNLEELVTISDNLTGAILSAPSDSTGSSAFDDLIPSGGLLG